MEYDEAYRNIENVFGVEPERILRDHIRFIDASRPVLDIGAGQGRNTLFLARRGFRVDAIDPSRVALETIEKRSQEEGLSIRSFACGFETFKPDAGDYSGVAAFGIIPLLTRESIAMMIEKMGVWTGEGGLVFLTAFTTADPRFDHLREHWDRIGKNSFTDGGGTVRTYLEANEILTLFPEFGTIYHWEGLGPEHRHGDGPVERHAMAEAVFRRR